MILSKIFGWSRKTLLYQPWDFFLEGMMLKLKLQYFGHLMWRVDSLEKTLMLGGIGGRRRRGRQRMRGWMASLTRWMWVSVNSGSWWWTGRPGVLQVMGSQRVGHDWATDLIWSDMAFSIMFLLCYFKYNELWSEKILYYFNSLAFFWVLFFNTFYFVLGYSWLIMFGNFRWTVKGLNNTSIWHFLRPTWN